MSDFVSALKKSSDFVSLNGATQQEIEDAEKELSLQFAPEFKKYLRECGVASADGHEFTGITTSKRLNIIDVTKSAREKNSGVPGNLYVVEELLIDHITIWQAEDGAIFQAVSNGDPEKVCDSLVDYLSSETTVN